MIDRILFRFIERVCVSQDVHVNGHQDITEVVSKSWKITYLDFWLQDEASKIKKEASDLDKLIDKTEKEYKDLRDDLRGKETEVRKLLEKGKTEQQVGQETIT